MEAIRIISSGKASVRPILEAALENELRTVEAGIRKTRERLAGFEARHNMSTQAFIEAYEADGLPETLDFIEWIGEHRLLNRLREHAETIKNIQIEN
jgi:hypothetical protein